MTRMRAVIVTFAVVFASIAADEARTADKMKLAVGQCRCRSSKGGFAA